VLAISRRREQALRRAGPADPFLLAAFIPLAQPAETVAATGHLRHRYDIGAPVPVLSQALRWRRSRASAPAYGEAARDLLAQVGGTALMAPAGSRPFPPASRGLPRGRSEDRGRFRLRRPSSMTGHLAPRHDRGPDPRMVSSTTALRFPAPSAQGSPR